MLIKFEEQCQKRNISLFIPPLSSPRLNGRIEGAHLAYTEEFYAVVHNSFHIPESRNNLLGWEKVSRYNRDIIEEMVLPVLNYGDYMSRREEFPRTISSLICYRNSGSLNCYL